MLLMSLLCLFLHETGAHIAVVNQGFGMSPSKSLCLETHLNARSRQDRHLHVFSPGSAPGGISSLEERGAKLKNHAYELT